MAGPRKPKKDQPAPEKDASAPAKLEDPKGSPAQAPESAPIPDMKEAAAQAASAPDSHAAPAETPPGAAPGTVSDDPAGDGPGEPADKTAARPEEAPKPEPDSEPAAKPEPTVKPDPAPATTPPPTPPAPVVTRRGPGFVPLVLGGIVAAAIGFAAARYVIPQGWPFGPRASELAALKARLADQTAALDKLRASVTAAQTDARAARDDAARLAPGLDKVKDTLAQQMAATRKALSTEIEANKATAATLETRLSALEKRPTGGGAVSDSALGAYERDVQALRTALAAEAAKRADLAARVDKLSNEVTHQLDAEARAADAEKKKAAAAVRTASIRAALSEVNAALTSGAGFEDALARLRANGAEVPAALSDVAESGVPTLPELQKSYAAAARAALSASIPETMGKGITGRITAFLQAQTGARSLTPRAGTSPNAVLSRAEAALDAGKLAKAVETLKALPKDGQAAMAGWVERAQARIDALAAAAKVADELGAK